MTIIEALQADPFSQPSDILFISVAQDARRLSGTAAVLDKALGGAITEAIVSKRFEGKSEQQLVFPTYGKIRPRHVVVLGSGKRGMKMDALRQLGGRMAQMARELCASTATAVWPVARSTEARVAAQAIAEGVWLGGYRFHAYRGTQHKKEAKVRELKKLLIIDGDAKALRAASEGIRKARILSEATNLARDLVNTPSGDMTPAHLVEVAQSLAGHGSGITCRILDKTAMERLGMRAALAVARGSMHPPAGVHLRYTARGAKKTIALVGKAVTFDSGGLSLKPADGMKTMKIDMAGAAAVLGLFKVLAEMKSNVNVHGIFLAVENMPSGSAYRPGDIVTAMDGTTIEVLNTDAEGRITLADALIYAGRQKPDMIVDLATLTGACVSALGEEMAGLLTKHEGLAHKLLAAAEETGEPVWRLPLFEGYLPQIRSKIADLKNIGGGHGAGAITAALFLKYFVGQIPWAHLDIAGPAYIEQESRPDQPYGASGYGVRLLQAFLEKIGK